MRSHRSGLVVLAFSGLFAACLFAGCAAGEAVELATDNDPTERDTTGTGTGAVLPPTSDVDNDIDPVDEDAGSKPSPKDGGAKDAGTPPPDPGSACTQDGQTRDRPCGACGVQTTVCIDEGSGLKWTEYGACEKEIAGGCIPGSVVEESCGNCGTVTKTCTQYCAYTSTACTGQPANSCKPGAIEYITAGCPTSGTYRSRTCGDACTWGGTTASCVTPTTPNKMTLNATVGAVVSADWTLSGATKRPSVCPGTVGTSTAPFVAVEVTNPNATRAVEVSIYQSKSTTGPANFDLVVWVYAGNGLPMTDSALGQCTRGVEDSCLGTAASNPCGNTGSTNYHFAGLGALTIPAGGKIIVMNATYSTTSTPAGDGSFRLNVRTDKLL